MCYWLFFVCYGCTIPIRHTHPILIVTISLSSMFTPSIPFRWVFAWIELMDIYIFTIYLFHLLFLGHITVTESQPVEGSQAEWRFEYVTLKFKLPEVNESTTSPPGPMYCFGIYSYLPEQQSFLSEMRWMRIPKLTNHVTQWKNSSIESAP